MPKRSDINSVLVIGAGPIIIGQACEFDYSGTQACKALREEGCRVVLINSNPATIMTDENIADTIYLEPITVTSITSILEKETIDAILPTVGGQTALNVAMQLVEEGIITRYNVELLGASYEAINRAEKRQLFNNILQQLSLDHPRNCIARKVEELRQALQFIGLPAIIRPSFTLGGSGGGIAYNRDEFFRIAEQGLMLSPIHEIQIDQSVLGWKEYEMEVVRDKNDNCIIVCTIENIDSMGVHTGDSITIAPAITLRDCEYQQMRSAAFAVIRAIRVETGGANVQFAFNPNSLHGNNQMLVIEANPRVSRSSALASKATGFPIAKVATKLALGYTLDELPNTCTPCIPASFEPTLDYIAVKIPRFDWDKFKNTPPLLSTSMKSVGEVMALGRSFLEAMQKALVSLDIGLSGFNDIEIDDTDLYAQLAQPFAQRILLVAQALRQGFSMDKICELTQYNKWFVWQIAILIKEEEKLRQKGLPNTDTALFTIKKIGLTDARIAKLTNTTEKQVRELRQKLNIAPVYKRIDSCAAEFFSPTAYMYSTYEGNAVDRGECEAYVTTRDKVIIIGSGPNCIGQGIEFDYACVHAVQQVQEIGYEAIMLNCNPETVSTDYDTVNRLYFTPLTSEHVLDIIAKEGDRVLGVIVQFGGQTALKLASDLHANNINILGTSYEAIDLAEKREKFTRFLSSLKLRQPQHAICHNINQVYTHITQIALPVILRPSYVLGGKAMIIIHEEKEVENYLATQPHIFHNGGLLIDKFLSEAIEVEVDCICDGTSVYLAAIIEHIEEAGIHSGDSIGVLPPYTLEKDILQEIKKQSIKIALALRVIGLLNLQFAVQNKQIYVLEVNPRSSRTVPFISKATGIPLAKLATQISLGETLHNLQLADKCYEIHHVAVKMPVFSFQRFPQEDVLLGPEMKSTGEVIGLGKDYAQAFAKAFLACKNKLPTKGTALLSIKNKDKQVMLPIVLSLYKMGFALVATEGTYHYLNKRGICIKRVNKVRQGRPHIVDMLLNNEIDLVINTSEGVRSIADSHSIRRTALMNSVVYCTTIAEAKILIQAIKHVKCDTLHVQPLVSYS